MVPQFPLLPVRKTVRALRDLAARSAKALMCRGRAGPSKNTGAGSDRAGVTGLPRTSGVLQDRAGRLESARVDAASARRLLDSPNSLGASKISAIFRSATGLSPSVGKATADIVAIWSRTPDVRATCRQERGAPRKAAIGARCIGSTESMLAGSLHVRGWVARKTRYAVG